MGYYLLLGSAEGSVTPLPFPPPSSNEDDPGTPPPPPPTEFQRLFEKLQSMSRRSSLEKPDCLTAFRTATLDLITIPTKKLNLINARKIFFYFFYKKYVQTHLGWTCLTASPTLTSAALYLSENCSFSFG